MTRLRRSRIAVASLVLAMAAVVGTPSAASAQEPADGCVTGLSLLIDVVDVGSSAGPPIVFSTGISVLGIAMPSGDSPIAPITAPAFSEFATVFRESTTLVSESGVELARQLRDLIEPLAAVTPQGDGLLHQIAAVLDTLADSFGPVVQPADRTMAQTAAMLRVASCS